LVSGVNDTADRTIISQILSKNAVAHWRADNINDNVNHLYSLGKGNEANIAKTVFFLKTIKMFTLILIFKKWPKFKSGIRMFAEILGEVLK
jgi:hypothetical protein